MSEATQEQINSLMARISSCESSIARMAGLEAAVAAIDDDYGEPQKRFSADGDGGASFAYRSYFRVVDASTAENCRIGVTDGRDWPESGLFNEGVICGTVKINNVRVDLEPANSETITEAKTVYVWLLSELTVLGEVASIVFGTQFVPEGTGLVYAYRLLGRVAVSDVGAQMRIADPDDITQDYLTGGEHVEYLNGDCGDYYAEPPS